MNCLYVNPVPFLFFPMFLKQCVYFLLEFRRGISEKDEGI